jgi:undecaprenyl-diphosphatase
MGLLTAWRIYLAATLGLHQDEAYYWLWTKHLALGYFDHPPMVGYFIWLTTILSSSEFFVRLSAILVSIILSVIVWKLSKEIFEKDAVAAGSVLLLNLYPMTMAGSIIVTPDVPAFLFWGLSVYFAWQIFRTQSTVFWYLTGIAFGMALVSKYTTVLFAPCLFLFLIFTDERKHLKTIHPYLALLVSFIVFLPVVYWNSQNDWISFKFQLGHGLSNKAVYSFANLLEYFGGQLMVLTPFAWLAGFYAAIVCLFTKNKGKLFLSLMSLPIILFFGYASLKKSGEANWPALAYFSFTIVLSGYLFSEEAMSWFKKSLWLFILITCLFFSSIVTLHARFTVLPLAKFNKEWPQTDATNFFYGWKELAEEVNKINDINGVDFIITPSHQLSALLSYYTKEKYYTYIDEKITRKSQFNLWKFQEKYKGRNGLYINTDEMTMEPYKELFASYDTPKMLTVYRKGYAIRTYRITYGRNFHSSLY